MSNVKRDLLKRIDEKVARKKALKDKIASRNENIEQFVLDMINDIEDMLMETVNTDLAPELAGFYVQSIHQRLKTLDTDVNIDVSWHSEATPLRINGLLIKWSPEYQKAHDCEPELFVDVASLLFN